jgi:hypothetical protein
LFWPLAYALFEKKRETEREVAGLSSTQLAKYLKKNPEARGLLRPDGPPRLFEKRRQLMDDFLKVAGSKKNVARIQDWYEGNKELLDTLNALRKQGALDVGDV